MSTQQPDTLVLRRTRRAVRTRVLGGVCAVILATAGCGQQATGGDRPSPADRARTADDKTATSSLRAAMKRSGGFYAGKDGCLATSLVRDLGVDKLVAAGLLSKELTVPRHALDGVLRLSRPDANTFADVTLHCVGWRLLAMYAIDDSPDLHDTYDRRCTAAVTEDDVRELLVAAYSGRMPDDGLPSLYKKLERARCGFEGDD